MPAVTLVPYGPSPAKVGPFAYRVILDVLTEVVTDDAINPVGGLNEEMPEREENTIESRRERVKHPSSSERLFSLWLVFASLET